MTIRLIRHLAVCVALSAAFAAPALAGDEGVGPSPSVFVPQINDVSVPRPARATPGAGVPLSTAATTQVVQILSAGQAFCASLPDNSYAIDCLAERMAAAAAAMPDTGEYADAKAALEAGAARLNALAVANADGGKPRASARQPREGGIRTSRPLVPVRADRLADVSAQAAQIVAETETLLLRSAETSSARKVHYARIATAVGSNKVLLRSI